MKHARRELYSTGFIAFLGLLLVAGGTQAPAQQEVKWMAAGSLQNWYSSMGCEIEVGRSSSADQQDGLQWPGWYPYQDAQAAKSLWIGTTNYTDASNVAWPYKVVHVGPRSALPIGSDEDTCLRARAISAVVSSSRHGKCQLSRLHE